MEKKGIWWRVYFWLSLASLASLIFGFIIWLSPNKTGKLAELSSPAMGDWLFFILYLIFFTGLYIFVFGKSFLIFSKFWKVIFWIAIVYVALDIIRFILPGELAFLGIILELATRPSFLETIASYIVAIPNYYAIYRLSCRKEA